VTLKSLKPYDSWGFEMYRYVSLLSEHRRIILCGPSGTGKSYLANKLAEFLVLRDGKESTAESIATFK
jgi:neuron navigator 2